MRASLIRSVGAFFALTHAVEAVTVCIESSLGLLSCMREWGCKTSYKELARNPLKHTYALRKFAPKAKSRQQVIKGYLS